MVNVLKEAEYSKELILIFSFPVFCFESSLLHWIHLIYPSRWKVCFSNKSVMTLGENSTIFRFLKPSLFTWCFLCGDGS